MERVLGYAWKENLQLRLENGGLGIEVGEEDLEDQCSMRGKEEERQSESSQYELRVKVGVQVVHTSHIWSSIADDKIGFSGPQGVENQRDGADSSDVRLQDLDVR